ncbi:HNH endonuclease [Promicromonospora alba]|uniref:HNH endonuclease n=1 Tax=Promicromonospora alba TaxID=1616110 RepID=A0ABV9HR78_9MICO
MPRKDTRRNTDWNGSKVRTARKFWATQLPLGCYQCGRPVLPERAWVVEHIMPRALGGGDGVENQWVSHRTCSNKSGSKVRAAKNSKEIRTQAVDSQRSEGLQPW